MVTGYSESIVLTSEEYILVELVSQNVAIYFIKTTTVYVSDQLCNFEKAREITTSSNSDKDPNVYVALTNPADPPFNHI